LDCPNFKEDSLVAHITDAQNRSWARSWRRAGTKRGGDGWVDVTRVGNPIEKTFFPFLCPCLII
jgi:hypothetical protein